MDWKNLTKQQKQMVILIGIVLFGAIYAFYMFLLTPLMDNWKQSSTELADLQTNLHKANLAIRSEPQLRRTLSDSETELRAAVDAFIPDSHDPYAWVTEKIYALAREADVGVEAVTPVASGVLFATKAAGDETGPAFDNYAVRIATQATFKDIVRLIGIIEDSNPYVAVSAIRISAQPQDVEKHRLNLVVEWPVWIDPTGPEKIKSLEDIDQRPGNSPQETG